MMRPYPVHAPPPGMDPLRALEMYESGHPHILPWTWLVPRLVVLCAVPLLAIAACLVACDGSSPTEPDGTSAAYVVETVLGPITVEPRGQAWSPDEVARQVRELEIIYADESGTGQTPALIGVSVRLEPGPWHSGGQLVRGTYDPGQRLARISAPDLPASLVRHELGHALCYQERLPCDCAVMDHPGGWDLGCRRLP